MKLIAEGIPQYYPSNGEFRVRAPMGVDLWFIGAPYKMASHLKPEVFKVKTATEQPGKCDVVVPCEDFGVPATHDMLYAVEKAIEAAFAGRPVFAGCMGGIGRTGTFLAVVLKALGADTKGMGDTDPYVDLVRQVYLPHAVETQAQRDLISRIDVSRIRRRVKWLWAKAAFRRLIGR